MARCISLTGRVCTHLKFNQKGNYLYHCNFNEKQLVQVADIDLTKNYLCPLDVGITPDLREIVEVKEVE